MPVLPVCTVQTDADVRLDCPASWADKTTQVLTCFLNATKYSNSTCKQFSDVADFQFLASGATHHSPECTITEMTKACNTGSFSAKGCRCREVQDGLYVLEFAVTGRRERHEGGTWKCVPGCFDDSFRNPFLHPPTAAALQCGPVVFGE